ncbi:Cytochrome P450 [Cordyceps militaris]|uniref:Cytochrome P450 n=1 Tax=Cordyceps militaris TaxID=73501 RepID=A0A2H4SP34_CORMI|nr:Cytochrome P450 [Cordyceps militaris]
MNQYAAGAQIERGLERVDTRTRFWLLLVEIQVVVAIVLCAGVEVFQRCIKSMSITCQYEGDIADVVRPNAFGESNSVLKRQICDFNPLRLVPGHWSALVVCGWFQIPPQDPRAAWVATLRKSLRQMFKSWTMQYGGVFRVVLGSKEVVVLNSREAVAKTLVKQGASYQTRPEWDLWHETFVHGAGTGGVATIGTARWTAGVSKLRKLLGPQTGAQKLPKYNHYVSRRYLRLVKLLAEAETDPKDLGYCWWSTAIGLVTDQLVGHGHDDDFVRLICDTEIGVFKLRALGDPLGDWVPLIRVSQALVGKLTSGLRYVVNRAGLPIPRLLRNANEEKCDVLRRNQTKYCRAQLGSLTRRVGNGDTTPSQLGDLFRALPEPLSDHDQFQLITTLSGSGMAIGTTLTWLVGYLASHPALQDVAFSAIQEVYSGEVPDPHDTDRVEYLKAMALEAGRYWTAIRLGFLRETNSDSSIDEYFVPKGTIVVYNSFQINRDPAAYDSPDMFLPERWMNGRQGRTDVEGIVGDKIGVPHMGHGAGRRLCLGVPNVNKSFYGILSLALHFFKFERVELGEDGLRDVFPSFRAFRQSSREMHAIHDQVSACDGQAVPCATGIRVIPRNPGKLAAWVSEGHQALQDFVAPWA